MMSEFSFDTASDWDLQAIVKGRSVTTTSSNNNNNMSLPCYDAWFESSSLDLDDYNYQLGHENSTFIVEEKEPLNHGISSSSSSPKNIVDSSMTNFDVYNSSSTDEPKKKAVVDVSCANSTRASILKRRKNKHKIVKVVQQAGGDRVMSDKWNWRKYGEKVIKGSPYPRSYYRCSYPGGCLARKQVEQSISDPRLFLITYMEEHSHPYPTRRHSQAGRSARRFNNSSTTKLVTTNESLVRTISSESSTTNNKDDRVLVRGNEDGRHCCAEYVGGEGLNCMGSRMYNEDDFFAGLDYLEGFNMDYYA